MNAFENHNKGTIKSLQYIQRDIERLRLEKSEPDAPIDYIQESIAASVARIQPLRTKLYDAKRMKEQLIKETNPIFERFILGLSRPSVERAKTIHQMQYNMKL